MHRISLTPHELELAGIVGVKREIYARAQRLGHKNAGRNSWGWSNHIEGAAGEMAFCKWWGLYYNITVGKLGLPDALTNLEIRTSAKGDFLKIYPQESKDKLYVAVGGLAPHYVLQGWLPGYVGRKTQYLKRVDPDRPAAYFVPVAELYQMNTLKGQTDEHSA